MLLSSRRCSKTRLLPSGRLSTAHDTGTRAERFASEAASTLVAEVLKMRITGVTTVLETLTLTVCCASVVWLARSTTRKRSVILVAAPPAGIGAATPSPDDDTNGLLRGSSTLTTLLSAKTCSKTRLLPSGRLSTAHDTGTRAV